MLTELLTVLVPLVSKDPQIEDLKGIAEYVERGEAIGLHKNQIAQDVAQYLTDDLAKVLDKLTVEFYQQDLHKQYEELKGWTNEPALARALNKGTYQEITAAVQKIITDVQQAPYILVQTPVGLKPEQRQEIRTAIAKEQKSACLPIFQVNQKLIGGMRVFVDGQVADHSWIGRINYLANLKI